MSDWISVKDKLPEERTTVQAIYQADLNGEPVTFILFATYNNGEWYHTDDFFGSYVLDPLGSYVLDGFYDTHKATEAIDGFEVTHWQSLPEPPEGVDYE